MDFYRLTVSLSVEPKVASINESNIPACWADSVSYDDVRIILHIPRPWEWSITIPRPWNEQKLFTVAAHMEFQPVNKIGAISSSTACSCHPSQPSLSKLS